MKRPLQPKASASFAALAILSLSVLIAACGGDSSNDPPPAQPAPPEDPLAQGREVFRYETFGNERFWTDAMQLPQGIAGAGVTPLDALGLGLNVNVEALSPATAEALLDALDQIGMGTDPGDTVLADPAVTLALINEGAVIGVVPVNEDGERKPLGSDDDFDPADGLDLAGGDKVGVTCALCHAGTDGAVVEAGFAGPGSVGAEVDGIVAEGIDVGAIFAAADNPLAYLPLLQLEFEALDATIGRGDFAGIMASDSLDDAEAAAREYLTGTYMEGDEEKRFYPLTSFDATPDGIGNATYVPPFFRTDLAAPWGHSGAFENLDDFNNLVYTVALDPTSLLTDEGRAFLNVLAGPVGDEIAERYEGVLRDTGVIPDGVAVSDALPLVDAEQEGLAAGSPAGPVGRRVAQADLDALDDYTDSLEAPAAPEGLDADQVARGEAIFNDARADGGANCAACHTANPNDPVRDDVITLGTLYPEGDEAVLLFERSMGNSGLTDVLNIINGPAPSYDDSVVVLDASVRGEPRGYTKPLLLALDSKDEFLHDGSVVGADAQQGLDNLLDPARGADAPHPFYFPGNLDQGDDAEGRAALVEYLRSRTTSPDS